MIGALTRLLGEYANVIRILRPLDAARYICWSLIDLPATIRTGHLYRTDARMRRTLNVRFRGRSFSVDCGLIDAADPDNHGFGGVREMFGRDVYLHPFDPARLDLSRVVDAGGNVGLFSLMTATAGGTAIYVECLSKNAKVLDALLALNGAAGRVKPEWALLGPEGDGGMTREYLDQFEAERVASTRTMPDILAAHGFSSISFLKMDIEGAEFPVLRGASWLGIVDNIAMELHREFGDPAELAGILAGRGFVVVTKNARLERAAPSQSDYLYASRRGALHA